MKDWKPKYLSAPRRIAAVPTAWDGVESAIEAIVDEFCADTKTALEFGVQHGYSASAFANFFDSVIGVDTFCGDIMAGGTPDLAEHTYKETLRALKDFHNVQIKQFRYEDWIIFDESRYDLIHVDIIHTFADTFACGRWAVDHAPVVLFHDTIAFPEVMRAVTAIADETGCEFYQWNYKHGLGILVRR